MTATEILRLIENVDPSDTAKLDEIDARVWCYIEELQYVGTSKRGPVPMFLYNYDKEEFAASFNGKKYTRSRDALKAIRPEGWDYACSYTSGRWAELWKQDNLWRCVANNLPNDELAELHCVIQAIEYERNQK